MRRCASIPGDGSPKTRTAMQTDVLVIGGGASGMIGTEIWFNGRLEDHPDADKIRRFIADRGYAVVDFPEEPLTDIGSIIWIP